MTRPAAVSLPDNIHEVEALADWMELTALHTASRECSSGDLERELDRLNCSSKESLLGMVLTEVDKRERSSNSAYPFERRSSSIQLKHAAADYPAYIFCLALSFKRWKARKGVSDSPWLLFEELAYRSAKSYLGQALLFGTSSRTGRSAGKTFRGRVQDLINQLGEGQCFSGSTFSSKDSKLDIVAWKAFPDKRASQIVIFGQCASGANWTDKLTELDPEVFWDTWMSGGKGKVSSPLRAVFIPHRVFDEGQWDFRARSARLLFDRCRVVAYAHADTLSTDFGNRLLDCCRTEFNLPV